MATKQKAMYGVLEGTFAYAKIAQPDQKYQSNDTEYSIQVIVDEDTADEWDSKFKKQPAKKIKVSEFEEKYKFECPIPGAKNVYAITLKRDATKNGEPFYPESRPRVFLDTKDGERVEISESRLLANGSFGKASYRIRENQYGIFANLANVLVDEDGFKEYIPQGSKGAGSEFGGAPKKVVVEPAREEATKARPARKPTADKQAGSDKSVENEFDESESPF